MPTPSLVIPSAPVYNEGNLYGLNVYGTNFVPEAIPYTRATTATRTNAAGLIELTPYNLVQYSEQFDNAAWSKTAVSVTANSTTSPSGIVDADTLTGDGTSTFHQAAQSVSVISGTTYSWSIYAKKNTNNFIQLTPAGGIFGTNVWANFDLNNGVVGSVGSSTTASIQSVGNGWYRCIVTGAATATASGTVAAIIVTSATSVRAETNTLSTSVFLWGAQLVEGTSALPYLKTDTRLNVPRVDFSLGGCPNLLLEPQRTNLALQSSSFDNATWGYVQSSVTANTTISPSGIQDADTFTANGTSNQHYAAGTTSGNVTSGVTYTMSVYMKKGTNNFAQLWTASTFGGMWANFDLNNGVVGSLGTVTGTNPTSSIQSVGNGWYRCIMTFTPTTTGILGIIIGMITSATSARGESNTLSTSVFLWGAQLEAGAYATSYIPTTTASVTRNADSFTESNVFSRGMITLAGGTWFMEFRNNVAISRDFSTVSLFIGDSYKVTTNSFSISGQGSVARFRVNKYVAGVFTTLFTTTANTCKIAIKWNGTTADIFENGIKVVNATAFTATALEFLSQIAAEAPKYIQQMALYPTPLSDGELITMTTL